MLRAQVVVTATVTFDVTLSIFSYSYAVTNNGSLDLAIVTFAGLPANPGTVMNLSAPTGFGATYDSGLGLISFFEDADPATPQTFAPGSTTAPFTFTSFSGPGAAQFEALDANGNSFTGPTVAPIPEPSTVSIFALSALLIFGASYRRIRQQTC